MFVAETTIREANNNTWGNYLVAGLGSLNCASAYFRGTSRALVGCVKSSLIRHGKGYLTPFMTAPALFVVVWTACIAFHASTIFFQLRESCCSFTSIVVQNSL